MNDQSKYWTRLERYTPTDNSLRDWGDDLAIIFYDIEPLENYTLSEKQWLHENLDKVAIINNHINSDGDEQIIVPMAFNDTGNSDIDFQTAVIEFTADSDDKLSYVNWVLFKHKDDWFYCLCWSVDQLYKCDGFSGLKKFLAEHKLLKK